MQMIEEIRKKTVHIASPNANERKKAHVNHRKNKEDQNQNRKNDKICNCMDSDIVIKRNQSFIKRSFEQYDRKNNLIIGNNNNIIIIITMPLRALERITLQAFYLQKNRMREKITSNLKDERKHAKVRKEGRKWLRSQLPAFAFKNRKCRNMKRCQMEFRILNELAVENRSVPLDDL